MKLTCNCADLSNAIAPVASVATSIKANDMFGWITLKAENNTLDILGFNGETFIESRIETPVTEDGTACVEAKTFFGYVKRLVEFGEVEFSTSAKGLACKFAKNKSTIATRDKSGAEGFVVPTVETTFKVRMEELRKVILGTNYCVASSDTRMVLKSCCIAVQDDTLTAFCIDGVRIAHKTCNLAEPIANTIKLIVTAKCLTAVLNAFTNEEIVTIGANEHVVVFKSDKTTIALPLVDVQPFNIESQTKRMTARNIYAVDVKSLRGAVERALILSGSLEGAKSLAVDFAKGILTIGINNEKADTTESVAVDTVSALDENLRVFLNGDLLLDTLAHTKCDIVEFVVDSAVKPVIIRSQDNANDFDLILPLRG